MSRQTLDPGKVPEEFVELIPLAEKWGIGDDGERETAIKRATRKELTELATCLDRVESDALFGWLAGPESYSARPSEEYLAFTCFTIAVDSAKLRLRQDVSE